MISLCLSFAVLRVGYFTCGRLVDRILSSVPGGAVHDYMAGMTSGRHEGKSIA